ncbi:MAG: putative toxin-antitoxin system toxin component, PIN family [Kiritimatiellae bacterium]|nr:putative toxin-antitoxin system toxin component, PIN family [Kiritimatiellia bacterium]
MMTCAVIDTNVIVAAMMSKRPDSATVKVVNAIRSGSLKPVLSSAIVDEYTEVLARGKFQFDQNDVRQMIDAIVARAVFLDPLPSGEIFSDETDRVFYEVALAGQVDATRLVTGNLRHYPISPIVVNPAQMVAILESSHVR